MLRIYAEQRTASNKARTGSSKKTRDIRVSGSGYSEIGADAKPVIGDPLCQLIRRGANWESFDI
jgi:hypothetical protein